MKSTTTVFAKFESVGRPKETQIVEGTVHEVTVAQAKWMLDVYMGSHIRITFARSMTELNAHTSGSTKTPDSDMMADLEEALAQDNLELGVVD